MKTEEYTDEAGLNILATAGNYEGGRVILEVIQKRRDELAGKVFNPLQKLSDEERGRMAREVMTFDWVLSLPRKARESLNKNAE